MGFHQSKGEVDSINIFVLTFYVYGVDSQIALKITILFQKILTLVISTGTHSQLPEVTCHFRYPINSTHLQLHRFWIGAF